MEQEEQPSFRRYVEDRRYYEVPARFAMHTAYMEVSNMQWWNLFSFTCYCLLEEFLIECWTWSQVALVLLYFSQ